MNLSRVIEIAGASANCLAGGRLDDISGFSIDTRTLRAGELFFAIKGERADGHTFVGQAFASGACAAVVERGWQAPEPVESRVLIRVDDTLRALQELAAAVIREWGRPVVAITGSSGKTTTKELTAMTLSERFRVHRSTMNLNNLYGLPLSVLEMVSRGMSPEQFDVAVLEMGMSTPGEIKRLCEIAPPHIGVVTNVSAAHLEFFSSVEAIAMAKVELIDSLGASGTAALNADDERVLRMRERHSGRTITFGIASAADVRACNIDAQRAGATSFTLSIGEHEGRVELPLPGAYNVQNAIAAAAAGCAMGLSFAEILRGLERAKPADKRGQLLRFREGFTLIDESYNSNPRALAMVLDMIAAMKDARRKILVAGEMLELGARSAELHEECGRRAAASGLAIVIGVRGHARAMVEAARGEGMTAGQAFFCESSEQAAERLCALVQPGDVIVVKGSRGVRTEVVVTALKARFEVTSDGSMKEQQRA